MVECLDVEEVMGSLMAISDIAESLEDCDPYIAREIKRIADLLLFELVEGGAIGGRASAGLEDPTLLNPPSTTTSERH